MKRLFAFLVLIDLVGLACSRSTSATEPVAEPTALVQVSATWTTPASPSVPEEYQPLYNQLDADLSAFLGTLPEDRGQPPIFAAELLYANGNVGPALLKPGVPEAVRAMLDSFQSIGIWEWTCKFRITCCSQTARANMEQGILSPLGLFYQQLIDEKK